MVKGILMNMGKQVLRLTENELKSLVMESARKILSELDWQTYASAAQKNDEWRKNNAHRANQWNRSMDFRSAARDAFDKKHGLEHQYDEPNSYYGGEKGSINLDTDDFEVSGSRDHDFGDGGGPFNLNHNVYHMGKKYGKDRGYGRTRMWDVAHDTTPEEFYGDEEMGKKFRDAEKDAEAFKSGKSHYVSGKGWSNESKQSKKAITEEGESFQNNQNYSHFAVNKATNKIVNGWDYSEYDPSELRQFKKDYFDVDMVDYGFNPRDYKIVTGKYLLRQGIDPDDNNNWANS